jgi:phospholipid/cholesterol/gamma-HCH transport system permease protein
MSRNRSVLGDFLRGLGGATFFLITILRALPGALLRPRLILQQLYYVGVMSLIIIVISGTFVGWILALQGFRTLTTFGATSALGVFVAATVIREMAPVVTALLFAGRAGSALAAEIGLMKATDQLSGMEMMAVDPIKRVIAPRFIAVLISLPLLTAIFAVMAIGWAGGHLIGVDLLGVDQGTYWGQIHAQIKLHDVIESIIKSACFGVVIGWISVYQGYFAAPTSEGVSRATTSTVVMSSLTVVGLDFVLTAFMFR